VIPPAPGQDDLRSAELPVQGQRGLHSRSRRAE
jgi:hypothetical protein